MEFNKGYYHTLDREYEMANNLASEYRGDKKMAEPLLRIDQIGTSVAEGKEGGGRLRQTVVAAMSRGVKEIELSLSPSNIQSGPASYSVQEREELRELAKINKVRFTSTHVSPSAVGNLSGLGQSGFSEEERQRQLNEIKQAIDFAAETTLGGAVVVHTGEFPRGISEVSGAEKAGIKEMGGESAIKERAHYLVNKKNGEIFRDFVVKEDQINYLPMYVGADGKPTPKLSDAKKDPIFDIPQLYQKDGKYETYQKTWDEYKKESDELKKKDPNAEPPEKLFFNDTLNTNLEKAKSQAVDFKLRYEEELIKAKDIQNEIETLKVRFKNRPEADSELYLEDIRQTLAAYRIYFPKNVPPEQAIVKLEQVEKNLKSSLDSLQDGVISSTTKIKELERVKDMTVPIGDYAKKKSEESLAYLGIEAYRATQEAKKKFEGREQKVNDIFIAPENVFPEMGYGSYTDEMIGLVLDSRKKMAEMLKTQGMKEDEAKKIAEKHIKATFDTEHLGMWKRYFQPKPEESAQEYHDRFNKWYVSQVDKLAEKNVLGHIHMADGFGMGHANLPPGAGILPIKDAVKHLKEKGYSGTFESEGFGDPLRQETAAWSYFGSPVYALGSKPFSTHDQVHQGYFKGVSPYRDVTPPYYPSEDWKLWSEVPLD